MIRFQIVIPTHNRADHLVPLLDSIAGMQRLDLLSDVYVVENGSAVARQVSAAFSDRLPIAYRYYEDGNKSKALNSIIEELDHGLPTIYLDDDVLVPPNLFNQYAEAIGQFGKEHYYGGPTSVRYEVEPNPSLVPFMPVSNRGFSLPFEQATEVGKQYFLGCNWACYPPLIQKVGCFSAEYGPGAASGARGQETDIQRRLYEAGHSGVYVPGEAVSHWVPEKAVQEDWILDRLEKASIYWGQQEKSLVKRSYWSLKKKYHGALQSVSVVHRCRYRIYKGLTQRVK